MKERVQMQVHYAVLINIYLGKLVPIYALCIFVISSCLGLRSALLICHIPQSDLCYCFGLRVVL